MDPTPPDDKQRRAIIREFREAMEDGNRELAWKILMANPDVDFRLSVLEN